MNYKNIYNSICNQIRKKYIIESIGTMDPMPSDGGGGQYFYPTTTPDYKSPIGTSETDPQPVPPKPDGHLGNPNFYQFPVSPSGMPIQIWVLVDQGPPAIFEYMVWDGQRYNPVGQPFKAPLGTQPWSLPNPNIPVVLPSPPPYQYPGWGGGEWLHPNQPIFGPGLFHDPMDPTHLNYPPNFNPNFWENPGTNPIFPPGYGVRPNYPIMSPDINDPYEGAPESERPGMIPGGIQTTNPSGFGNQNPVNPFAKPGWFGEAPGALPNRRPMGVRPAPRPPRRPTPSSQNP